MAEIGFVVLERNQAGGHLTLADFSDIARTREEAEIQKAGYELHAANIGRKDRYIIATLEVSEDDRD